MDELVNWFNETDTTYRGELRELNDLNFARFDTKLAQRLAEVRADLRQEILLGRSDLRAEIAELRVALEAQGRMLIKWMFGFWLTTVTTVGGLIIAVLHFLPAARP